MIRIGEFNLVDNKEAKEVSLDDLIRYADKMKETGDPTTFRYFEDIPFPEVVLQISPIYDEEAGDEPFMLIAIEFIPNSDLYMMLDTEIIFDCLEDSIKKYNEKTGSLFDTHYVGEEEKLGLIITAAVSLVDANIKTLADVIKHTEGDMARIFVPSFYEAAKKHKNHLDGMIKDFEPMINGESA